MARYTIIRVYGVAADSQYQAVDRFQEALIVHAEKDYLVKDIIREPDAKPGQGKKVSLAPPAGWLKLLKDQLLGSNANGR